MQYNRGTPEAAPPPGSGWRTLSHHPIVVAVSIALLSGGTAPFWWNLLGAHAAEPSKSTICKFNAGPRAGETQDYAPRAAVAVGTPCHDGTSSGSVIAGVVPVPDEKKSSRSESKKTSTLCKFSVGSRSGETEDYAPQAPLPIGTPCQDGIESRGKVVAP